MKALRPARLLGRDGRAQRARPIRLPSTITAIVSALVVLTGAAGPVPMASALSSHSYYIDCSARSTGSGSVGSPWKSLSSANTHGQFMPGDRVLIRRGTRCRGHLRLRGSGTAARRIVLSAYGRGAKPLLQGGGTTEETGTVQLDDVEYWTVSDLHLTNAARSATDETHRSGLVVSNRSAHRLHDIIIRNLAVTDVTSFPWVASGNLPHQSGGISVVTSSSVPGAGFDGLRILSNRVDRVGRSGIVVWNRQASSGASWDDDVRVSRNTVTHAAGDGILLAGARRSRIDHNVAADGSNLPRCPIAFCPDTRGTATAGIWPIFSKGIRIDHNEAYGTKWGPGDGEGFDIDNSSRDVVFEYNYAHDNEGGGLLLCGSTNAVVRFNIFQNNRKSALVFIGTVPAINTQIYNNTIYNSANSRARPVRYFNGRFKTRITFKNNIVYNFSYATWLWPTRPKTEANTLIGLHKNGRPVDKKTSRTDPELVKPGTGKTGIASLGGYKPKHPSEFTRGVPIPGATRLDFFGKRIDPKHPPRGAAG